MNEEIDYELTAEQWETLKALRLSPPTLAGLRRTVIEDRRAWACDDLRRGPCDDGGRAKSADSRFFEIAGCRRLNFSRTAWSKAGQFSTPLFCAFAPDGTSTSGIV